MNIVTFKILKLELLHFNVLNVHYNGISFSNSSFLILCKNRRWIGGNFVRILFVSPYRASRIRARSYGFITQLAKQHFVELIALFANTREISDVQALHQEEIVVTAVYELDIVLSM